MFSTITGQGEKPTDTSLDASEGRVMGDAQFQALAQIVTAYLNHASTVYSHNTDASFAYGQKEVVALVRALKSELYYA